MLLTIKEIKKHVNLDDDFTEDDEYLSTLCEVAESLVQKHIDKSFDDIIAEEGGIPTPLSHAILLFIGNLYANRESVSYGTFHEIPNSLNYILNLYRDYENCNI